jgi:hypothetical protein
MPLSPKLRGHLAPAAQSQTKVNPLGERGALDRHEAHFHSTLFPKRSRHRHGRFALRYGRPLEQRTVGRNLILGHAYGGKSLLEPPPKARRSRLPGFPRKKYASGIRCCLYKIAHFRLVKAILQVKNSGMLRVTWPILNRVRDCCRSIQAFEPKRWNGPVLPLSNFAQTQYGYKGITSATHLRDAEAGLMSFGADGPASVRHGAMLRAPSARLKRRDLLRCMIRVLGTEKTSQLGQCPFEDQQPQVKTELLDRL